MPHAQLITAPSGRLTLCASPDAYVRFEPGEIAEIKRIAIARSVESGNWKGFTSLIREAVIAHLGLHKGEANGTN